MSSRKLNFDTPLMINLDTTLMHEELAIYDTVKVVTQKANEPPKSKSVFYTTERVDPGDLFTGRLMKADGTLITFSIHNPCFLNFRTDFDAIQRYSTLKLNIENAVQEDDEEITYEAVTPDQPPLPIVQDAPRRNPLKRTWARIGSELTEQLMTTEKLVEFRPNKIQKLE